MMTGCSGRLLYRVWLAQGPLRETACGNRQSNRDARHSDRPRCHGARGSEYLANRVAASDEGDHQETFAVDAPGVVADFGPNSATFWAAPCESTLRAVVH